ncbi:hypothetical protein Vafri_9885 [Volvox africanus]|uniref:Uncharacterized protein n=1 Tax=Volvox africanus TaxID=51714 RepID=A0A8J4B560_9CHLO|nr:hypothetical protein Vafri_9885 [Volvox africanus]
MEAPRRPKCLFPIYIQDPYHPPGQPVGPGWSTFREILAIPGVPICIGLLGIAFGLCNVGASLGVPCKQFGSDLAQMTFPEDKTRGLAGAASVVGAEASAYLAQTTFPEDKTRGLAGAASIVGAEASVNGGKALNDAMWKVVLGACILGGSYIAGKKIEQGGGKKKDE